MFFHSFLHPFPGATIKTQYCIDHSIFTFQAALFSSWQSIFVIVIEMKMCCNRKLSPKNVFGASTGFEPMVNQLNLVQLKTHMLGAGQFIEFIVPVKGIMKHISILWTAYIQMKWRRDHRSSACDLNNRKLSPKNVFGASSGFEPVASALALQCSTNWVIMMLKLIYWTSLQD